MMNNWGYHNGFGNCFGFGAGGGIGGYIAMGFHFLILLLVIYFVVKLLKDQKGLRGNRSSALQLLEERFVRGEISEEEFDAKKSRLINK